MKFGARLRYECVAEWESKYIRYTELKKLLSHLKKAPRKRPHTPKDRRYSLLRSPSVPHLNPNLKPPSQPLLLDLTGLDVPINNSNNSNTSTPDSPFKRSQLLIKPNDSYSSDESSPLLKSSSGVLKSSTGSTDTDYETPLITFAERLREELNMVNEFYVTKEEELVKYWVKLVETADLVTKEIPLRPSRIPPLKRAFREFYHGLCMLQNYVELNLLGFTKILKKHDKLSKDKLAATFMPLVEESVFNCSNSYKTLMYQAEELYLRVFKLEKRSEAKKELQLLESETHFHLFKLGIFIGGSIAFALIMILLFISNPVTSNDSPAQKVHMAKFISVIPVYRVVLIPLIALWLWGLNVYIWTKFRINYILIFGLDPRTTLCHRRVFKTAAMLTSIFLFSFTFFVGTIYGNFSFFGVAPEYFPLILVSFCFILVIFPFRAFHRKARVLLFTSLLNVFITPFGSVKFRYLYLGDVLTSMVKTLFDVEYTICYFVTGDWKSNYGTRCTQANNYALPILSGLPLAWRFCQCLKRYYQTKEKIHLGNTGKYAVGFSVVLFSALYGNFQSYPLPWTAPGTLFCTFRDFPQTRLSTPIPTKVGLHYCYHDRLCVSFCVDAEYHTRAV
eukprot:TRINITY_DN1723_c0_g5_i1.p1 TRINITY_DN1723_c0_g5~~TRINITY_DN1723_c0_g5_i1.p1  ORF type:complete len:618 (-),score=69.73 TRINITY_DN1723_c0_g5_i1:873-2726(-)